MPSLSGIWLAPWLLHLLQLSMSTMIGGFMLSPHVTLMVILQLTHACQPLYLINLFLFFCKLYTSCIKSLCSRQTLCILADLEPWLSNSLISYALYILIYHLPYMIFGLLNAIHVFSIYEILNHSINPGFHINAMVRVVLGEKIHWQSQFQQNFRTTCLLSNLIK